MFYKSGSLVPNGKNIKMKFKFYGQITKETSAFVVEVPAQRRILFADYNSYYISLPRLVFIVDVITYNGLYHLNGFSVFALKENQSLTKDSTLYKIDFPNTYAGRICLGRMEDLSPEELVKNAIKAFYAKRFLSVGKLSEWARMTKKDKNYVVDDYEVSLWSLNTLYSTKVRWREYETYQRSVGNYF
jgi:hypothetical protein